MARDSQPPAPPPAAPPQAEAAPKTAINAALDDFRANRDPDATVLWKAKGPKNSHTTELAGVLVEIDGVPSRVIVQGFGTGAYKVFREEPKTKPAAPAAPAEAAG